MKFTVEIVNTTKAQALIHFLEANDYVVQYDDNPMSDVDWSQPGRPATNEEIEEMAMIMDNEPDGEEVDIVFDRLLKKYSS